MVTEERKRNRESLEAKFRERKMSTQCKKKERKRERNELHESEYIYNHFSIYKFYDNLEISIDLEDALSSP